MASVAVIGAGLTGLTAAYRLKQRGIRVVVYEATDRIGGVIRSERRNGFLADLGPNSMAPSPAAATLLQELGLESRIVRAMPEARNRYIVRRGRLIRLPLAPAELLTSRLLSNGAKLAVFGEPLIEPSDSAVDESVAAFIRRRFNQEVLDYVVNPFIAGTCAGDPEQLSLRHALPQLQALERNQGSVVKALVQQMKARKSAPQTAGITASPLISLADGLQELTDALGRSIGTEIRLRAPVTQLRRSPRGWTVGAALQTPELYDAVVYAAPSHALDEIDLDLPGGERLSTLASIVHPPVAVIALGFQRGQISHPLDGFGFLTPEVERRRILGTVFSSTIFPGRAPEDSALLTVFVGGTRDPDFVQTDSQTLTARVLDELRILLGVSGEPTFRSVQVWPKAIPQYVLGYGRFKDIASEIEQRNPGLVLAGTYRDGISLPEAIASGERAASALVAIVTESAAPAERSAHTVTTAGQD